MPGSKRNVSGSNVSAKRGRLSRELSGLEQSESRLEFQRDLQDVQERLARDPSMMKRVKLVMKITPEQSYDREAMFHPDLEGRAVTRVPLRYLTDVFLRTLGPITSAQLRALQKADSKAPTRILLRMALVTPQSPIGPLVKAIWSSVYKGRVDALGYDISVIKFDANFVIDWQRSGHYALLPPVPPDTDPAAHRFERIEFRNLSAELDPEYPIKGNFVVQENWDFQAAYVQHPTNDFMRYPCMRFFQAAAIPALVPPFDMDACIALATEKLQALLPEPTASVASPMKAIEDGVVSQAGSSDGSTLAMGGKPASSPAKSTTAVASASRDKRQGFRGQPGEGKLRCRSWGEARAARR